MSVKAVALERPSGGVQLSVKHVWHTGNHRGQPLPACCRHGLQRSRLTAVVSDRRTPRIKLVGDSPTSHNPVGWCRCSRFRWVAACSSIEQGVSFEGFAGVRDVAFRWIPTVPHLANPVSTNSAVAATDRKWSPTAVLGVFEGGNGLGDRQAVPNSRENMSGTPGIVADI